MRQGLSLSGCDERSRALPNGAKKNFLSSYLHDDRGNLIESTWKKESVFEKKKNLSYSFCLRTLSQTCKDVNIYSNRKTCFPIAGERGVLAQFFFFLTNERGFKKRTRRRRRKLSCARASIDIRRTHSASIKKWNPFSFCSASSFPAGPSPTVDLSTPALKPLQMHPITVESFHNRKTLIRLSSRPLHPITGRVTPSPVISSSPVNHMRSFVTGFIFHTYQ